MADWEKVLELDALPEGRAVTVTCGTHTLCVTHHRGQYGVLDNRCPHQAGPLGEGTIERGWLRCPWHGWDFDPLTGDSPGGHDDGVESFPVEIRKDGVYACLPEEGTHAATMTDRFAQTLVNFGVRWTFGMVGHSNLGLADALRRLQEDGLMGYVAIRHEGAASFACSAYGKLTGRPAACLAIAGPGATNLLTGLWDAHVDRSPVLALTGQVGTQWLGRHNFQEIDLAGAFGDVAVFTGQLLNHTDPGELAALACRHAQLQRGVSHVIFPDEVQTRPARSRPFGPDGRLPTGAIAADPHVLQQAIDRLDRARRPLIIAGHGAREDAVAVRALAETLGAPVVTTFKAKGLLPDSHPLAAGVLGRSGTPIASFFMNEADLLLVLGASFSKHTGITDKVETIQVDRDALALGNRHPVDVLVQGELSSVLPALMAASPGDEVQAELALRWQLWRDEKRRREDETRGQGIHSAALFAAMGRQVPPDAILAVDVGNNTYSFGRYFETSGDQRVLMSGYLGSIGFALPAALGAWAATQEDGPFQGRKVISISGDGGLGQYLAELTTLVRHRMDVTHVVLNNSELGKISKEQRAGAWPVWQTRMVNPSFAAVAEQCGLHTEHVTDPAQLDAALARAIAHPGPALVEVITDAALL